MRLKQTYDKNNRERVYREDQSGKEYLYYRDKRHGIIIRDFTTDDSRVWFNAMNSHKKLLPFEKNYLIQTFKKLIGNKDFEDEEFSLMVTDLIGNMVAQINAKQNGENCECELEIVMGNVFRQISRQDIVEAICQLYSDCHFYDVLYLTDCEGNRTLLQVS